jgi:hypothetical protein
MHVFWVEEDHLDWFIGYYLEELHWASYKGGISIELFASPNGTVCNSERQRTTGEVNVSRQ